jgi:hypothetical protein
MTTSLVSKGVNHMAWSIKRVSAKVQTKIRNSRKAAEDRELHKMALERNKHQRQAERDAARLELARMHREAAEYKRKHPGKWSVIGANISEMLQRASAPKRKTTRPAVKRTRKLAPRKSPARKSPARKAAARKTSRKAKNWYDI